LPAARGKRSSTGLRDSSSLPLGRPLAVAGYTVAHRQIVEIDPLADPAPSRPGRHPFADPARGVCARRPVSAILTAFANDEMTKKDA
jgi:hypothetical protein